MKKYFLGLLAVVLAAGFSAFTKPVKKATCMYIFKYIGPSTFTQSDITNRNNWGVRILSPYIQCIPDVENQPCSFTTECNSSYLTVVASDMYKPSTDIIIIAKQSDASSDTFVVDHIERTSDHAIICLSVENFAEYP